MKMGDPGITEMKYDYLRRRTFVLHDDQYPQPSEAAVKEFEDYQPFEFYDRQKMKTISSEGRIQDELNGIIGRILEERIKEPEGGNIECLAMNQFTEFLSKLDLVDFRKIKIETLMVNGSDEG